jgi:hypothetical protein
MRIVFHTEETPEPHGFKWTRIFETEGGVLIYFDNQSEKGIWELFAYTKVVGS